MDNMWPRQISKENYEPPSSGISDVVVVPFVLGAPLVAAAAAFGRSLLLNRLWKKFCNTSCCVCPPEFGDPGIGFGDGDALPTWLVGDVELVSAAGRPAPEARPAALPDPATSISDNANWTVGRLKLLGPNGPTIPAAAPSRSAGFRNAPRGSRSGFLEFSS